LSLQANFARKILVVNQRGTIVKDSDVEIQLESQRRDGLGDVSGAGDPKGGRRCDCFVVEPAVDFGFWVLDFGWLAVAFIFDAGDGEIMLDSPGQLGLTLKQRLPKLWA